MTDDREAVLAANRAFYQAFESLDGERMAAAWLRDARVTCIHPGWQRLLGFGAVMKSWEDIFAGAFGVRVEVRDEVAEIRGDTAWVTCTEVLETRLPDGVSHGLVEATNVFERRDGRWLLVHHHGSPLARRDEPDGDLQLH